MTVSELVKVLQNTEIDYFMVKSIERDGVIFRDKDGAKIECFKDSEREYGDYIVNQVDIGSREDKLLRFDKLLSLELKKVIITVRELIHSKGVFRFSRIRLRRGEQIIADVSEFTNNAKGTVLAWWQLTCGQLDLEVKDYQVHKGEKHLHLDIEVKLADDAAL